MLRWWRPRVDRARPDGHGRRPSPLARLARGLGRALSNRRHDLEVLEWNCASPHDDVLLVDSTVAPVRAKRERRAIGTGERRAEPDAERLQCLRRQNALWCRVGHEGVLLSRATRSVARRSEERLVRDVGEHRGLTAKPVRNDQAADVEPSTTSDRDLAEIDVRQCREAAPLDGPRKLRGVQRRRRRLDNRTYRGLLRSRRVQEVVAHEPPYLRARRGVA